MDDLRAALRPLVDEPSATPPGLGEIAARARRRGARRRSVTGGLAAVAVVGALGIVGVSGRSGGDDDGVRTAGVPAGAPTTTGPDVPDRDDRGATPSPGPVPPTGTAPPTTAAGTDDGDAAEVDPGPPSTVAGPGAPGPPTTPAPPRPVGPHDPFAGIEAEDWGDARGVGAVAVDSRGGTAVTAGDGAWLAFPDVRFGTGLSTAVEVVAAPGAAAGPGAVIEVRLDDVASPPFATIAVPAAGGDPDGAAFVTLTAATSAIGGTHDLYVTFASPRAGDLARVDRLRFLP